MVDESVYARKFTQPYLAPGPQIWGPRTVSSAHEEALLAYGEYGIFTLMWRPADYDAGLVGKCSVCFTGPKAQQAAAFNQPTKRECPSCYGTTFEGGYRAQIIRPMIMSDRATVVADQREGTTETDTIQFETTSDFTFTLGDYVIRFDNTRFQCETKAEVVIRTGFDSPTSAESLSSMAVAHKEAETSVAFLLPPADPSPLVDLMGPFHVQDPGAFNVEIRPGGYL